MVRCWRTGLMALAMASCAPPQAEHARAQWLQQTLVLDNQIFLERDPEQAGGKLGKMGERLYRYFRGTAPQYARDVMQPGGPGYWPSGYESAATRGVALVGDPHPENIGTFLRASGQLVVDFNDFDASTYGPYGFDLRRLALGFWIAGEQILRDHAEVPEVESPLTADDRDAAARAVARGYAEQIAIVADDPQQGLVIDDGDQSPDPGAVLADLMEGAREDGDVQEKLLEYTVVEGGTRTMRRGDIEPRRVLDFGPHRQPLFQDTVQAVTEAERAQLVDLLAHYQSTRLVPVDPAELRLVGASRRLGAGVSSYPVHRYYALLEGPTEAVEDDVLLEVKQIFDAVPMPALVRFPPQPFFTNGERVIALQRELQAFEDDDPWLGWGTSGADSYRIRWRTGYQRGVQVQRLGRDLAKGDLVADDYVALAELAGRLLARSHGRARTIDGALGAPVIAAAIGGDSAGLVDEVAAFVDHYAPRVVADHQLYVELLDTQGTQLSYQPR